VEWVIAAFCERQTNVPFVALNAINVSVPQLAFT
jgi:hypothetical protein